MTSLAAITEDLAQRIKARREGLILTQLEAAEQIGVSPRTLQNWEAGTTFPRPKHRRALERFLNGTSEAAA